MCGGGRMRRRAVARVVLPEEVGPERATRRGLAGLLGGGGEGGGVELLGVGMVGKGGGWGRLGD